MNLTQHHVLHVVPVVTRNILVRIDVTTAKLALTVHRMGVHHVNHAMQDERL